MRSKMFDKSHHTRRITDRDVLRFPKNRLVQDHRFRGTGQFLILTESGNAYQHVTMIACDEGRVDA